MLNTLQKPAIIFAPMPKSASNTLLERLLHTLDATAIKPKSGGGIGHLIIDARAMTPALKTLVTRKTPLVYQHFLPTEYNRKILQSALNTGERPKVIVSVRNIFDAVLSARRHQWQSTGPFWIDRRENEFYNADNNTTSHAFVWNSVALLKFYAAWAIAHETGEWDVKFVTYDEILNAPARCVNSILEFYNLPAAGLEDQNLEHIVSNISPDRPTKTEQLPQKYVNLIHDFAASFQGIDFGILGLTQEQEKKRRKL